MVQQVTRTEITFTRNSTWQAVDLNSVVAVPAGSTYAIVRIDDGTNTTAVVGWRPQGGSDDTISINAYTLRRSIILPLNVTTTYEFYSNNASTEKYYIEGYGDEITWITPVAIPGGSTATWQTIDATGDVPAGAQYVVIGDAWSNQINVRKVGDTHDRSTDVRHAQERNGYMIAELDGSKQFQLHTAFSTAGTAAYIVGWIGVGGYKYISAPSPVTITAVDTWEAWGSPDSDLVFAYIENNQRAAGDYAGWRTNSSDTITNLPQLPGDGPVMLARTDTGGAFDIQGNQADATFWLRGGFIASSEPTAPTPPYVSVSIS